MGIKKKILASKYKELALDYTKYYQEENYFSVDLSDIFALGYQVYYIENFILPYLKESIKRDLGVDVNIPTHKKLY